MAEPKRVPLGGLLTSEEDVKLRRELVTPEGIPIGFKLGQAGDRAAAFLLDLLIMFVGLWLLQLLLVLSFGEEGSGWARAFVMVLAFFVTNFYFIFFEIRWQGATPGKRAIGLRVVDRKGGQLTSDAIVARNFMRQVEVFLPAAVLFAPEQLWPGAPGYARLAASAWVFVLMLMPLFNKDRLRVGDFVGGTLVVEKPKTVLLPDLGSAREPVYIEAALYRASTPAGYTFSREQLSHYGVYELQVLEQVLRKKDDSADHINAVYAVCERIRVKIKWKPPEGHMLDQAKFLNDFYTAQRAHLEQQMLFGKKREDKFSK